MSQGQTPSLQPPVDFLERLRKKGVLVIANPKSGQGDSPLPPLLRLLDERGIPMTERQLTGDTPMSEYVEDAADFAAVIGAGGDGTVSSLAYALRGQDVGLFAVPAGTANLIALNLNIPAEPEPMLELLLSGRTLQLDIGEIETGMESPEHERTGFAMLAGAGADATMIQESEGLKEQFGAMAYLIAAMKQINPKTTRFHITADGKHREFTGMAVMAANFGMANYRIPITGDISPRDGELTIILVKGGNILRLLPNLFESVKARLNLGDPRLHGNLETFNAREITVDADEPFPLQYDGEIHKRKTPFTARVLPGAVRFFTAEREDGLET